MTKVEIVAKYFREFNKVINTIESCITETQLRNSEKYVNLFIMKWNGSLVATIIRYDIHDDYATLNDVVSNKFKSLNLKRNK